MRPEEGGCYGGGKDGKIECAVFLWRNEIDALRGWDGLGGLGVIIAAWELDGCEFCLTELSWE